MTLTNALNFARGPALLLAAVALTACPVIVPNPPAERTYGEGFAAGFAEDGWYWEGFYDSYDTIDFGPIYYEGGTIPYVDAPPYDSGYWDGVWRAYNDGYFVAYDYAFTIGFSDGYDRGFNPDAEAFLAADEHVEYLDGGWSDGYNDGYSEGRVFGAYDYNNALPFDWLDALVDYRDWVDVCYAEVCTGAAGPVWLYEYGTDPNEYIDKDATPHQGLAGLGARLGTVPSERSETGLSPEPAAPDLGARFKQADFEAPAISYRPLDAALSEAFSGAPPEPPRSAGAEVQLATSWLDRLEAYRATYAKRGR